jgi:hypothetical protein
MSLTKKSDVTIHVSSHNRPRMHLYRPASQPDATGFSGEASGHQEMAPDRVVGQSPKLESVSGRVAAHVTGKSAQA